MIFFDLDDTLVDHSSAVAAALATLRETHGLSLSRDVWQQAHRRFYPRYLRGDLSYVAASRLRVRHAIGAEIDDPKADRLFADYLINYQRAWRLFSDVGPCLRTLEGHRLGLISNGPSNEQRRKLDVLGLSRILRWLSSPRSAERQSRTPRSSCTRAEARASIPARPPMSATNTSST